jgi:Flp pilus assembly protein TadD
LLGQLFVAQNSTDRAIAEFQNLAQLNPKSVEAHVMLGLIYEMRKEANTAQNQYRQALSIDAHSVVAANNLAWLMAESGGNLDEALKLAQAAAEKQPNTSNVMDTMGWIYYKKKAYRSAVDLFRQCLEKDPQNPVYAYHLGMSYFAMGDRQNAKVFLNKAITINSPFAGIDEAKRTLNQLS